MNVPIKFRGRGKSGDYYYGGVYQNEMGTYIIVDENYHYGTLKYYNVEPDSVAQLVDYDIDKQELYEGDTVTDQYGNRFTVILKGLASGFCHKGGQKPLVFRLVDDED